MIAKLSIISSVLTTLAMPLANAVEYPTGYVPLTPEQQAAADATSLKVTQVLPNRLALQRVAAERSNTQGLTVAGRILTPVEDGADIIGVKGGEVALPAGSLNLTVASMAYPRAVDNSAEAWFPPVSNQLQLGSCASFCSTYYTMTSQVARLRGWNVKSDNNPAHIFSTRFTYNLINWGVNLGSNHNTAYNLLIASGCATNADFPYDGVDYQSWPTAAPIWRNAINYRMAQKGTLFGINTESGLAKAKQMLANGYVFNFAAAVVDWQFAKFSNDPATTADDAMFASGVKPEHQEVAIYCNTPKINHAMTVVGYNDDLWCDLNSNGVVDAGEKGALRIINSWGPDYRDGGFAWVGYDSLKMISSVPGAYSGADRRETIADARLDWVSARASYTPSLVAEVTITHAQRNEMGLSLGCSSTSVTTPTSTGVFGGLYDAGGSLAFDGTTTPIEATFVADCTDLLNRGSGNRWYVSVADNASSFPATLSKVQFKDSGGVITGSIGTNPSGGLPRTVDNSTVYAYADRVMATNLAPVAATQNIKVIQGTTSIVSLKATDPNSNALDYSIVTGPSHGTLTGTGNLRSYTANPSYQGIDFLTFKANDGMLDSNLGMIVIRVGAATPGLQAEFFNIDTNGTLPDLTGITPSLKRIDSQIKYVVASDFPSGYTNNFSTRHTGYVKILTAGNYTFYLTSDDGSKLWINEMPVVLNDGSHGAVEKSGSVNLTAGYHVLRVEYCQGGGGMELTMKWAGPSIAKAVVPASVLFYPAVVGNAAPVVQPRAFAFSANTPAVGAIVLTATDSDFDVLTFATTRPAHGSLFGEAPNLTYLPNPGYSGPDSFSYLVNDGIVDSNTETVTITVTNAAPTVVTAAAASANPVIGLTTGLSALGAIDTGEGNLTYTWTTVGTPPAAVTFSENASNLAKSTTATFRKSGSYVFLCTMKGYGGLTVTSSVTVVVNQIATTSLVVKPLTAVVNLTQTQQFSAGFIDQFGELLPTQPTFTWALSDTTSGTLSNTALFTANLRPGGPYIVTATSGGRSVSVGVTVVATNIPAGPPGYTWCGSEGTSFTLRGASDVAYGGGGKFAYKLNQTGTISFTNSNFSPDPAPGTPKSGFYKRLTTDFGDWALANNVTGGVDGDSDRDGISNGVEFALMLTPAAADGTLGTIRDNVLSYKKRPTTADSPSLTYRIEVSSDLGVTDPWTEKASTQNLNVIETTMPATSRKMFARLRVIVAP